MVAFPILDGAPRIDNSTFYSMLGIGLV